MKELITVDLRAADSLTGLFLTPRNVRDAPEVVRCLGRVFAGASPPRRATGGIRLSERQTRIVLEGVNGLDVRADIDAVRFLENRMRARAAFATQLEQLREIKNRGPDYAQSLIADSAGLFTLDPHQIVNVAAMTMPGGFGLCVFDEQGAGKTVTFIFAFDLLVARDEADRALIVAPKSMVPEWPRDIQRFRGDLYRCAVVSGTTREKKCALMSDAEVLVTNFETAVSMEQEIRALMRACPGRFVVAVDESFFIKSLEAKRTRVLRRLREWCDRGFVLCGTPAPNTAQDLVQQFNFTDFGLAFDGVDVPEDRDEAAPVVQSIIEDRGLFVRHLKRDVLPDLPAKRFQRVLVPMEAAQRRLYAQALNEYVSDLEAASEETFKRNLTSFFARRSALLQLCSNPGAVAEGYEGTPAKLTALDSLIDSLVTERSEKVVIWSFYTGTISEIVSRYERYGALRYDGQVSDVAARREAVRRFQEDDSSMVFVANPAAAGAGLTLHRARYAVYESFSNQAAHYLQSLDRIHRRGQERDVEYFVLLCEDSIEIQEYERLVTKEKAAQSLLGDRVDETVSRDAFLEDARAAAALLGG